MAHAHFITIPLFSLFFLFGCTAAAPEGPSPDLSRDEARAMQGKGDHGLDLCEWLGWYGDGICDEFCSHPDPDCDAECVVDSDCPRIVCFRAPCPQTVCNAGSCEFEPSACPAGERECPGCAGDTFCMPDDGHPCPLPYCPPPPPPADTCGGFAGLTCPTGQFCDYDDDSCGFADQMGTCSDIPDAWIEIYAPVCGCDGVTYGNEGEAHGNAVDVQHVGECEPPPPPGGCSSDDDCGEGMWCTWCWTGPACIPEGALC